MKWTLLIIFSLVLVCSTNKAKKKSRKCNPPTHGSVTRHRDGTVSYSCDEGFELIGRRETVCDKTTRRKNRLTACFPVYDGEVNCTALHNCPNNVNYLKKFDIGDIDEALEIDVKNATALIESPPPFTRSAGSTYTCKALCSFGMSICQAFRKMGQRKLAKQCWACYRSPKRSCPVVFWG